MRVRASFVPLSYSVIRHPVQLLCPSSKPSDAAKVGPSLSNTSCSHKSERFIMRCDPNCVSCMERSRHLHCCVCPHYNRRTLPSFPCVITTFLSKVRLPNYRAFLSVQCLDQLECRPPNARCNTLASQGHAVVIHGCTPVNFLQTQSTWDQRCLQRCLTLQPVQLGALFGPLLSSSRDV